MHVLNIKISFTLKIDCYSFQIQPQKIMFITLEMIRILFGRVGLSNLIQTTKMVELINQKLLKT